jgi:hypothetical protein
MTIPGFGNSVLRGEYRPRAELTRAIVLDFT